VTTAVVVLLILWGWLPFLLTRKER
jgi:hypothetical protein